MNKYFFPLTFVALIVLIGALFLFVERKQNPQPIPEAEAVIEILTPYQQLLRELEEWERPEGAITIALQVGHLDNHLAPEEFPNLANNTGAEAGGIREVDYNLEIAERVKPFLEERGMQVEILPAVIPPEYYADLFIAIHADGSENASKRGYKASTSRYDLTGKGERFAEVMQDAYGEATGLQRDPNISNNMLGYYAFNWRRYEHSLHPMTVGIILETGFLSNAQDRRFLLNNKDKTVQGIVQGVLRYIEQSALADVL